MKHPKVLSVILAGMIAATGVMPSVVNAAATGDLNGDGVISADDLTILQDHILGKKILTEDQAKVADINGDKSVDVHDMAELRKLLLATQRDLKFKQTNTKAADSAVTDAMKKLSLSEGDAVVTSQAELKSALSKYVSADTINSLLTKYTDEFFADSVLLVKPVRFDPSRFGVKSVEKLSCGCTNTYAGIYTPSAAVTEYMNIRKEHDYNSASIGKIYPGTKFTITHANGTADGNFGHVTINGVSGYVNMGFVTKVSSLAPTTPNYTPDIVVESVQYKDGEISVTAKEVIVDKTTFTPNEVAQVVLPKKDYYATGAKWNVTTITTTTPTTTTTTTTTVSYPLAQARLNVIGKDLKKAFNDAASITYYGRKDDPNFPQDDKTTMQWYADYGFKNRKGNCYVMAAMFCEMAKLLGYDAHMISGQVPLAKGGYGPHSWVEVTINGTLYVCDPDFQKESGKNGYMIQYKQSGTWVYQKQSVMS